MPLVFACITPHGSMVIPELTPDADDAPKTRRALQALERRCAALKPDVLVVATPHGTRVDGTIALAGGARAAGTLRDGEAQIELNVPVDMPLTDAIASAAREAGVPIALQSSAGNAREQSACWLDWGVIVPLWFLGYGHTMPGAGDLTAAPPPDSGPSVVVVAPSRSLPRSAMVDFGRAVATAAEHDPRRIAFVASCDWSHTHAPSGPYGFHPAAAEVDRRVVAAIEADNPGSLIDLPDELAQQAAIDGLWQALMLAGLLEHTPMHGELLSYEAPTYFGMLVAHWEPN